MTTKEFAEKLNQDIMEKILAAGKNPEAVYAIAKEAGVTDSFDAFKAEMTAQYEAVAQELSEEELAAVAGGGEGWKIAGGIAGAVAAGAGAAWAFLGGI